MQHCEKTGEPKILPECTLPLTGMKCVNRIVTDLAVIDVTPTGLELIEIAEDTSVEDVQRLTGAPLRVAANLRKLTVSGVEA
jgi:3-oxoacid CoA-transferase B subunit